MLKQFQNSIVIVLANRKWLCGDNVIDMSIIISNGIIRYVFKSQLKDL
jgi:hypothetical protein